MDDIQPLPMPMRRKTCQVRGPRPCSWISSSSDSSFNEHQDIWRNIQGHGRCRRSTLRSTSSHESSDCSFSSSSSSSSSSSPVTTSKIILDEFGEKAHYRHTPRRKPAGPRAPHNNPCFDTRPRLETSTSPPAIPQLGRGNSPTTPPPVQIADTHPQFPPSTIHSPTNFLLDWDAIFEMLECS